jgi:type IX secretion system PorP/SprF family membrane protein
MIKRIYISVILLLGLASLKAQVEIPRLSQYLINGMVINPAYAGSRESLSATLVHKSYLSGFEGNPTSQKFAVHTPLKNEKIALGISVENNTNPLYSNTGLYGHYAYRMHLGGFRLSMGLKGGIYHFKEDYTDLDLYDRGVPDPAFANNSGLSPNFGAGVYLYNNKFFTGLSVPYFLDFPKNGELNMNTASLHYILTTGYLFDFTKNFKLKPSALFDYNNTKPDLQAGLHFIMFQDKFWVGSMYRTASQSFTGIIEVQINSSLRMGYAYDYFMTSLSNISGGTHEFMLRYELNFNMKVESPIYF